MADEKTDQVTDDEIERIFARGEAGIADLIAAYEPIERQYFNAASAQAVTVAYATNTTSISQ
jgi:hypothetical protein